MRGGCTFKKRDVEAALKATFAVGIPVARVEVGKDGKIAVFTSAEEPIDDLDQELKAFEARHGR